MDTNSDDTDQEAHAEKITKELDLDAAFDPWTISKHSAGGWNHPRTIRIYDNAVNKEGP
jgi:hypothetical protein